MNTILVSAIGFQHAPPLDRERGLLGWASFQLAGLRVDGAPIRRTRDGRVIFVWPEHVSNSGLPHPIVRPVDDEVRRAVELEVLDDLRRRGFIP